MKYFVLSDVHSEYDLMIEALKKAGYDKDNKEHKIIFVGDAFDKGSKPLETYLFFKELVEHNKMVWILGNHDVELMNVIKKKKYSRDCRNTPIAIAKYYDERINENSDVEEVCSTLVKNGVLDFLEMNTVDYFELDNYVFTHGFIPTWNNQYVFDWRKFPREMWNQMKVRCGNGAKMVLKNGITIPGKTLVVGHVGAYFAHLISEHPDLDLDSKEFKRLKNRYSKDFSKYHTFISPSLISLDGNGYKTGIINVVVLGE